MEVLKRKRKPVDVQVNGDTYMRIPIKTHLISKDDQLMDVVSKYTKDLIKPGDLIFVTEKVVAITQGRSIPIEDVNPGKLARILSTYTKNASDCVNLCIPETMQIAINECGVFRMVRAVLKSCLYSKFGKKGVFKEVAGYKAISIDAPSPDDIPPYNTHIILAPLRPDSVAVELSELYDDVQVAIVHNDDYNRSVLGVSHSSMNLNRIEKILKDNPLGQRHEQTPIGIIRKVIK
jgi:hypothetical protein